MVMTFILNSFSGSLVRSVSPDSFSGEDVWVSLVCIKFFCLFMAIEVVVGSWHVCWLGEYPILLDVAFLSWENGDS